MPSEVIARDWLAVTGRADSLRVNMKHKFRRACSAGMILCSWVFAIATASHMGNEKWYIYQCSRLCSLARYSATPLEFVDNRVMSVHCHLIFTINCVSITNKIQNYDTSYIPIKTLQMFHWRLLL